LQPLSWQPKPEAVQQFTQKHGLAVRAVAIEVSDVAASYATMTQSGGSGVVAPCILTDSSGRGEVGFAEVSLFGDVVLRLVDSSRFTGAFLPNFQDVAQKTVTRGRFGLERFDHIVGNLWSLEPTAGKLRAMTGFHDFAEFVAEDVGTLDSGLNSVVLANNNEMVLLPLNEPTFGTKRKSQIQTYLEQNNGEGVQHMALFTSDIFATIESMRAALGGFEFIDPPGAEYYTNVRRRLGSSLSEDQYRRIQELGLLADQDDQGVLLQVFTKPVGDRATLFLEIIQRVGCLVDTDGRVSQKPGCGGFGKGNFRDLFRSIEDYEATLKGI
jgi:4-hydroxyphenylpyruvate dioxygenase